MYVDVGGVRKGSGRTSESAEYVQAAASRLEATSIDGGMFGRVFAAESVAARLATVHSGHVDALKSHHAALSGISRDVIAAADSIGHTDNGVGSSISRLGLD